MEEADDPENRKIEQKLKDWERNSSTRMPLACQQLPITTTDSPHRLID